MDFVIKNNRDFEEEKQNKLQMNYMEKVNKAKFT